MAKGNARGAAHTEWRDRQRGNAEAEPKGEKSADVNQLSEERGLHTDLNDSGRTSGRGKEMRGRRKQAGCEGRQRGGWEKWKRDQNNSEEDETKAGGRSRTPAGAGTEMATPTTKLRGTGTDVSTDVWGGVEILWGVWRTIGQRTKAGIPIWHRVWTGHTTVRNERGQERI